MLTLLIRSCTLCVVHGMHAGTLSPSPQTTICKNTHSLSFLHSGHSCSISLLTVQVCVWCVSLMVTTHP